MRLVLGLLAALAAWAQPELRIAPIGELRLESGASIENCKIGYRTFGQLNADRSNAILFPTWFGGNTAGLAPLIGPGQAGG